MFTKEQIQEIHNKLLQYYSKKDIEVALEKRGSRDFSDDTVVIVKENGDNTRVKIEDIMPDVEAELLEDGNHKLIFTK